jgi:hypothetical protein
LKGLDGLGIAIPINLGEGFVRGLKFPVDTLEKAVMATSYTDMTMLVSGDGIMEPNLKHGRKVLGSQAPLYTAYGISKIKTFSKLDECFPFASIGR